MIVRRFRASILTDNVAIRRLMQTLAAGPLTESRSGTVSEVEFELAAAGAQVLSLPIAGSGGGVSGALLLR